GRYLQTRQALRIDSGASLKNGGFAPDVLAAAVFFVNKGKNFVESLNEAITFAGPENYCPVVVGAVGGARWGAASIPRSTLSHCDIFHRVQAVADLLAGRWQ
ncbi:ADP-ribosylglycohydrolase family protein, partial [bacterium]|nr:ADP-ribosylglycohydrolase family protein [bacterium]